MKGKLSGASEINDRSLVLRSSRLKKVPNSASGFSTNRNGGEGASSGTGGEETCQAGMGQAQGGFERDQESMHQYQDRVEWAIKLASLEPGRRRRI